MGNHQQHDDRYEAAPQFNPAVATQDVATQDCATQVCCNPRMLQPKDVATQGCCNPSYCNPRCCNPKLLQPNPVATQAYCNPGKICLNKLVTILQMLRNCNSFLHFSTSKVSKELLKTNSCTYARMIFFITSSNLT